MAKVLQIATCFYDPLGWFTPIMIWSRMLVQELHNCQCKPPPCIYENFLVIFYPILTIFHFIFSRRHVIWLKDDPRCLERLKERRKPSYTKWTSALESEEIQRWTEIRQEHINTNHFLFNRTFLRPEEKNYTIQLHLFVDASIKAYGTVAYMLVSKQTILLPCTLLMAKSKVTPLKSEGKLTIPRLKPWQFCWHQGYLTLLHRPTARNQSSRK